MPGCSAWKPDKRGISHFMVSDGGADPQRAGKSRCAQLGGGGGDALQAGLHFREIGLGAGQQRRRAPRARTGAAHMVLEDADLLADRAVRDAQFIGGGREAAQPGGRLEYQRLERRQAVTGHVRPRPPAGLRGASLCCDFPRFPLSCRYFPVHGPLGAGARPCSILGDSGGADLLEKLTPRLKKRRWSRRLTLPIMPAIPRRNPTWHRSR